ncbi:hypothetical protein [Paraliobacillus salinarum]|uniref:hypothetical protein n=1 Tax=Paraliobacillus salinarum TaxID=1158996 RepID=UPI0015F6D5FF|nr:hypothetical protein [Paraliobacillus salinarum]
MNILSGILAATVAFSGGMGLSLFSGKEEVNQPNFFENPTVHVETMFDWMRMGDFDRMEKFMKNNGMDFDHMRSFRTNDREKSIDHQNRFQEEETQYEEMDDWMDGVAPVHAKEVGVEKTGNWMAEEDFESMERYMEEEHVNNEEMYQYMDEMHRNFDVQRPESRERGMNRDSNEDRGFREMGNMHN